MRILAPIALFSLAGCMQDIGPVGDALVRDTAKGVVNTVVERQFPGVNARPLTDCVIDNATTAEVFTIAEGAITGPDEATTNLVVDIAGRPETVRCTANSALGLSL